MRILIAGIVLALAVNFVGGCTKPVKDAIEWEDRKWGDKHGE